MTKLPADNPAELSLDFELLAPGGRKRAREAVLIMLYQYSFGDQQKQMAINRLAEIGLNEEYDFFAKQLFLASIDYMEKADQLIKEYSHSWDFERLFAVDKTILRYALAELNLDQTPATIIINEAIEAAKKFGDDASPAFVNAVLDAVHKKQAKDN